VLVEMGLVNGWMGSIANPPTPHRIGKRPQALEGRSAMNE